MSQTAEHYCNRCRKVTHWKLGLRFDRCTGCRTQFPCAPGCTHFDCREARDEVKTCPDCRVVDGHLSGCTRYVKPVDAETEPVVILESSGDELVSTGGTERPDTRAAAPEAATPTGKT
jgi:hypothetical protein